MVTKVPWKKVSVHMYLKYTVCMQMQLSSLQIYLRKAMHKFPSELLLFFVSIICNIYSKQYPKQSRIYTTHQRGFPLYSEEIVISKVIEHAIQAYPKVIDVKYYILK